MRRYLFVAAAFVAGFVLCHLTAGGAHVRTPAVDGEIVVEYPAPPGAGKFRESKSLRIYRVWRAGELVQELPHRQGDGDNWVIAVGGETYFATATP